MQLTHDEIDFQAQKGYCYFDFNDPTRSGGSFIITGDGVNDLDRLLSHVSGDTRVKIILDAGRETSSYKWVDLDDTISSSCAFGSVGW